MIQRLTVCCGAGWPAGASKTPFISAKRVAFQILVTKLRFASTCFGPSFGSRPIAAMLVSVKRRGSAPNWSMRSRGSMTLPLDFDIFAPFSSRTRPWT